MLPASEYQGYLLGGKDVWQSCYLHVQIVYKFWEPQPPGALYRASFTCIIITAE
jgi:hypothetical protein